MPSTTTQSIAQKELFARTAIIALPLMKQQSCTRHSIDRLFIEADDRKRTRGAPNRRGWKYYLGFNVGVCFLPAWDMAMRNCRGVTEQLKK